MTAAFPPEGPEALGSARPARALHSVFLSPELQPHTSPSTSHLRSAHSQLTRLLLRRERASTGAPASPGSSTQESPERL